MKYLTFEKDGNTRYLIMSKDKCVGKLIFDISTWFFMDNGTKIWNWYILQEIVDKLKELNKPIDDVGTK